MLIRIFITIFLIISQSTLILADTSTSSAVLSSSFYVEKNTTDRFKQLRDDYLYQLDLYKQAEKQFLLDRAEFNKLQTLASREKAVLSMKPYLIARAKVLFTYLVVLEYLLQDSEGLDISDLNLTLEQLNTSKQLLLDYQETANQLVDRESANLSSKQFETVIRDSVLESQFRALTLLALGKVQRAYDQHYLATTEFKEKYVKAIDDATLKATIERGLKDVDFQNDKAKTSLTKVITDYPDFQSAETNLTRRNEKPDYQGVYNDAVRDLQVSFSAMKRSMEYLKELEMQI